VRPAGRTKKKAEPRSPALKCIEISLEENISLHSIPSNSHQVSWVLNNLETIALIVEVVVLLVADKYESYVNDQRRFLPYLED
jgi:hypothetical protein